MSRRDSASTVAETPSVASEVSSSSAGSTAPRPSGTGPSSGARSPRAWREARIDIGRLAMGEGRLLRPRRSPCRTPCRGRSPKACWKPPAPWYAPRRFRLPRTGGGGRRDRWKAIPVQRGAEQGRQVLVEGLKLRLRRLGVRRPRRRGLRSGRLCPDSFATRALAVRRPSPVRTLGIPDIRRQNLRLSSGVGHGAWLLLESACCKYGFYRPLGKGYAATGCYAPGDPPRRETPHGAIYRASRARSGVAFGPRRGSPLRIARPPEIVDGLRVRRSPCCKIQRTASSTLAPVKLGFAQDRRRNVFQTGQTDGPRHVTET